MEYPPPIVLYSLEEIVRYCNTGRFPLLTAAPIQSTMVKVMVVQTTYFPREEADAKQLRADSRAVSFL